MGLFFLLLFYFIRAGGVKFYYTTSFDSNFTITKVTTSWAASVIDNENCNYTFKGTYTGIVDANSSVTLGFQAIKNGTPEISEVSLNDVVYNGIEGSVETYGFEVGVDGNKPLNINFQLAARASEESLRLDESIVATNVHPDNYNGVYFHFFETETVRNAKTFSIGFELTQDKYNRIVAMDDPSKLSINVMISHGLYGTPSKQTIWVTGKDILNAYDSTSQFFEFATISYDAVAEEYAVSSNYWLIDSDI